MAFDVLVQEAQTYAQENGLFFMETSAKTAKNVNEIFYEIGTDPFFLSYQGIENLQQVVWSDYSWIIRGFCEWKGILFNSLRKLTWNKISNSHWRKLPIKINNLTINWVCL